MLQTQTVTPGTLSLLRELMNVAELKDFYLVGGTALSLIYGHRISEDLDLFSLEKFFNDELINNLSKKFNGFDVRHSIPPGIFGYIRNVKVDLVKYPHPIIRPTQMIDGIRIFSVEDIIAMKVQAILGRGKKKDFYDVFQLLQHYTVADFVVLHKEKFSTQNLLITVPQALTYFDDADESEDPVTLINGLTWEKVKRGIEKKVRDYLA
jgi:predicted nucleotidyltransferase component of viral defense system